MDRDLKALVEPDSAFMKRFRDTAPGTYKHCESVASLVDAVAGHLDIDRDNLYVAAKIHDIGKICNPDFFCENQQSDENVHDKLTPELSFQFLSRHVSDGLLLLLQEPCIPRRVLELVSQHHGNSVIKSICKDNDIQDKFRYRASPPKSVEACVLMMCDVAEAATKSLFSQGKLDDIYVIVTKLVDDLIDDKQLDFMRIGEARVTKMVIVEELKSFYHKRIDYEDSHDTTDTKEV